jgi:uncharacterized protein (TIGR03118 family)
MNFLRSRCMALAAGSALAAATHANAAVQVSVTNLVSDDGAAYAAQLIDPGLVNAWGVSFSATSPFWVSSNGGGTSLVYKVDPLTQAVTKLSVMATIPGEGNVTGQVFNAGGASQFNGESFLFVSEDGTVSGWRGALGSNAESLDTLSAIYKGAAYASVGGSSYLYAADFHGATIDVFKGNVGAPVLGGSFTDPTLPAGYAPFNVQALAGSLYVAYAKQDPNSPDEVAGAGFGYVDRFDFEGNFIERVANQGSLNAPWGLAIAPASFGAWAGALLVGNFGDGRISAFDPSTHDYLGQILGPGGQALSIDGLWAITVGNGVSSGSTDMLYFTAGPADETHGLFGVLAAVPEPSTYALMLFGLGCVGLLARRRLS